MPLAVTEAIAIPASMKFFLLTIMKTGSGRVPKQKYKDGAGRVWVGGIGAIEALGGGRDTGEGLEMKAVFVAMMDSLFGTTSFCPGDGPAGLVLPPPPHLKVAQIGWHNHLLCPPSLASIPAKKKKKKKPTGSCCYLFTNMLWCLTKARPWMADFFSPVFDM
jgi:hypothetical protein